jgi:hypothetical protein
MKGCPGALPPHGKRQISHSQVNRNSFFVRRFIPPGLTTTGQLCIRLSAQLYYILSSTATKDCRPHRCIIRTGNSQNQLGHQKNSKYLLWRNSILRKYDRISSDGLELVCLTSSLVRKTECIGVGVPVEVRVGMDHRSIESSPLARTRKDSPLGSIRGPAF